MSIAHDLSDEYPDKKVPTKSLWTRAYLSTRWRVGGNNANILEIRPATKARSVFAEMNDKDNTETLIARISG